MPIVRMYKTDNKGNKLFREAWYEDPIEDLADATDAESSEEEVDAQRQFVVNHGTVGHVSKTSQEENVSAERAKELFAGFIEQSTEDGYRELADDEQFWVIAQFALKTKEGTDRDISLQTNARREFSNHLAWRGLGTVESSDFAPWKLNLRILTPDAKTTINALKTISRDAKLDPTKLRIAVAPFNALDQLKQRHPLPATEPFTLD
ncbi:hypothetical protein [Neomicrococcus lactis]|uniref:Uncharacterized protein n=1 Tax=Neomicrococcus lactis TaxID=732241 RepID=A0A7W8Y9W6_9MICC|nr:hypothetical protein [Neomicrococcus lactis]